MRFALDARGYHSSKFYFYITVSLYHIVFLEDQEHPVT